MDHHSIEQFVLSPDVLSDEEKSQVWELIEREPEAAAMYEWYKEYRAEKETLERGNRIYLTNFHSEKIKPSKRVIMAARTDRKKKMKLEAVASYISAEQNVLLRIIKDYSTKKYKLELYFDEDRPDYTVLSFLGSSFDVVYNDETTIEIPEESMLFSKGQLKNLNLLLYKPQVKVEFLLSDGSADIQRFDATLPLSVTIDSTQNTFSIQSDERFTYALFIGEELILRKLSKQEMKAPGSIDPDKKAILYLF